MKHFSARVGASVVVLGLSVGLSPASFAASTEIEEIVVTAQKRETNLQQTPIAITAITQEQIQLNRIQDFADIALHTPSMSYTELQGFSQASIRGVGTDLTNLANETAIAMYEDGVYRGATFSQTVPQFDLERIEVLRGPQGTLYGRNATGGAINIVTRMPSSTPEFNASLTGGNYARTRVELGASGPLTDGVLGRVSFVTDSHSGFNDNKTLGKSEGDNSLKGGHATLQFDLSDTTELVLRGNYTRNHGNTGVFMVREISPTALGISPENLGGVLTVPGSAGPGLSLADAFGLTFPQAGQPVVVDPDDHDSYSNDATKNNVKQYGGSATLSMQLGNVTSKLILGRQDAKWVGDTDTDGTDVTMLFQAGQQSNRQNTAELNFSGNYWNDRATWMVGGFYFQEDGYTHFYYDLPALQQTFEALFGIFDPNPAAPHVPLPPGSLFFFGTRLGTGQGDTAPFLDFRGNQNSKSWAYFGQTTIDIVDNLHLTLGARYTDDTKDMHRELSNNLLGAPCNQHINEEWNETTGTGIINYDFSENAMAYLSASKGFKAGGYNVAECEGPFDPETIWAYELGAKFKLFDNRLQLNGATFVYKYDDIQVNQFVNNASSITNAAEADIYGAELEFVALVGSGFEVDGGVTYLHSEYGGGASFPNPILGGPGISVDGNDTLRSPPWKTYLGAQYEWDTGLGRFILRADMTYSDSFYFDVFQASLPDQSKMEQDAYTVTNAHIAWESTDAKYSGQLFCQNITDELYANSSQAVGTTGAVMSQYSSPRQYGIRVSMKMGGEK